MSSEYNGVEINDLLQSKTILISLLYILMVKYILIMNIILSANACYLPSSSPSMNASKRGTLNLMRLSSGVARKLRLVMTVSEFNL